jgi:dipeptidyl-peptidase 4
MLSASHTKSGARQGRRRWSALMAFGVAGAVVATAAPRPAAAQSHLTVERVAAFPNLAGTVPINPVWSPDSAHLAFLWNDKGYPFRDVWVAATDGKLQRVTDMAAAFPEPEPAGLDKDAALAARAAARQRSGVADVAWMPDGKTLVFSYEGRLLETGIDGTGTKSIGPRGGHRTGIAVSPNGSTLSFIDDGDLWFRHLKSGEQVPITHVARRSIAAGAVPGGTFAGLDARVASYKWSADSRHVALSIEDRTHVRTVLIPNYLGADTHVITERRDFPGDNDQDRYLSIYTVDDGRLRRLELAGSSDRRIGSYDWSPDSSQLLVDQSSENVVHRWLYLAKADDGTVSELYHDQRDTRTSAHWNSKWQSDGKGILLISDLDGRHAIYSLPLSGGGPPKRLTDIAWSVIGESNPSPLLLAAKTGDVYFLSTKKNEEERQVYRMPQGGGPVTQVTTLDGVHFPYLAPDGRTVAVIRSNDVTPPDIYLLDVAAKTAERRVTHSPTEEFGTYPWIKPRYVTFKSHSDGALLHGRLWEPSNLDRNKKYAAILGPVYSNSVRNRWGDREEWRGLYNTFQEYLVMEGQYVVLQVDVRGSVGHGREFREQLQRDFGGIDVEDVHSGAEYLATLGYVDMNRLGVWGSSYGGLMTAMSLFKKPGVYKAGVASSPATNVWHATTGEVRVTRRPDSDPEVFRKTSAVSFGENLQDHLLIVHGMEDDIVLFKDSVTLAEKLMLLGKKFDIAISPTSVHSWSTKDYVAAYMLNKIVDHFDRYLGRGPK